MTQAATVTKLTLEQLGAMCREKAPDRLTLFEEVSAALTDPWNDRIACKEKLEGFVRCPVRFRVVGNEELFSWEGRQGTYELRLMRTPKEGVPQSPLGLEEPDEAQAEPQGTGGELQAALAPQPQEQPQAQHEAEPTPGTFTALAALLGDTTLLMTIARTGEEDGEPTLSVNVVPKSEGEAPFAPVSLEGRASDLDRHFVQAIQTKVEGQKSIRLAIEELKAADEALAQARKLEAEAKKREAEAKKKNTQRKEENAQAGQKTQKQQEARKQDALF